VYIHKNPIDPTQIRLENGYMQREREREKERERKRRERRENRSVGLT